MPSTSSLAATFEEGNARLLELADILDGADEEHEKRKEPKYSQIHFVHRCGSAACALGHWALAKPERWEVAYGVPRLIGSMYWVSADAESDACLEFCLSLKETNRLFGVWGCSCARTAKDAAKYIRAFANARIAAGEQEDELQDEEGE